MIGTAKSPSARRQVLIAHFDLFRDTGGGQSVYKAIVAARPNDVFYYFRRDETADATRPANAVGIPWKEIYVAPLGADPGHFFWAYLECRNMAASVARHCRGVAFDVVDVPDFSSSGLFMARALRAEGVHAGITALAMHGTLSRAFRGGWPVLADYGRLLAELAMRENLQFRSADARYAISGLYEREWREKYPLAVNRLDPLCVVDTGAPVRAPYAPRQPDLAFVGRREKWKGPDLFLDIAWSIDPAYYNRLIVAGADGPNHDGSGSTPILREAARLRRLNPEIPGNLSPPDLRKLFDGRTVLMLPSRHDTFNLVALEAVLRGCPVHVSHRAGVAEWLRANLPEFPWMIIDIDCARTAAGVATETLGHYDRRRDQLVEHLALHPFKADSSTVERIYTPAGPRDADVDGNLDELAGWFATQIRFMPRPLPVRLARPAIVIARLPR